MFRRLEYHSQFYLHPLLNNFDQQFPAKELFAVTIPLFIFDDWVFLYEP